MNSIQLLTKAGQIVDELARSGPSTPAALSKAVSEPRPSVYRITSALQVVGVIGNDRDGRLILGPGVLRWGHAVVEAFVDRRELHKQLEWVREQVGMNAYFAVLSADGLVCLDRAAGAVVDLRDLEPGTVLASHAGAAAHVALAFANSERRRTLLEAANFRPMASRTPVDVEELSPRVDRARVGGWAIDNSEIVDGVASVAVPVFVDGLFVGVLFVAGLRESVVPQSEAAVAVLAAAARTISVLMSNNVPTGRGPVRAPGGDHAQKAHMGPSLIVKAGALMDALAAERVASSARLTALTDEPASSVYRMLATLAEIGWVEQVAPRGAYRVGARLLTLASELLRALDIRGAARPILEEVHAATGETTFLCVRNGGRAVCIERVDGDRVNSRVLRIGRSLPLHIGAAPRALLAFEGREAWDEYAAVAELTDELRREGLSRAEMFAQLEEICQTGVAISDNTVTPGIAAIGAPIFDHDGRVAASLSVSGLRDGILAVSGDGRSVRDLVTWGAAELSRYLGWVEPAEVNVVS